MSDDLIIGIRVTGTSAASTEIRRITERHRQMSLTMVSGARQEAVARVQSVNTQMKAFEKLERAASKAARRRISGQMDRINAEKSAESAAFANRMRNQMRYFNLRDRAADAADRKYRAQRKRHYTQLGRMARNARRIDAQYARGLSGTVPYGPRGLAAYGRLSSGWAPSRGNGGTGGAFGPREMGVGGGQGGGRGGRGGRGGISSIRAIGHAAHFANRRLTTLRHSLLSYRTLMVGGFVMAAGSSFLDATIGNADDIQRSRSLLMAALGDARKVDAAFAESRELAANIGPLTLQEAVTSMKFMVPLAGGDIEQAGQLTRMAKALEVTTPEQGFGGALFALRELIGSGQVRSLRERFNISGLPTRTEAADLADERGVDVAEVYMTSFRERMNALYGQGGQDAVTALLRADVESVRGQITMIRTIISDALADVGLPGRNTLFNALAGEDGLTERFRSFVQGDEFAEMAERGSAALVTMMEKAIDFAENGNEHLDTAGRWIETYGPWIERIAKLYALNVVTGGAVTALGGVAMRRAMASAGAGRTAGSGIGMLSSVTRGSRLGAAASGMRAGVSGMLGGGAGVGYAGWSSAAAGGALTTGAAATGSFVLAAGALTLGLAKVAWTLTHLETAIERNTRLQEEAAEEQKGWARKDIDPTKQPGYIAPRVTALEHSRAVDASLIAGWMNDPGVIGHRLATPGGMTSGNVSRRDISRVKGEWFSMFGGEDAVFTADDEERFNDLSRSVQQRIGMSLTGYEEGGRVGDIGFSGGYAAMTPEERALNQSSYDRNVALSGAGGLGDWMDAVRAVSMAAQEGKFVAMQEAVAALVAREDQSLKMAEEFSTAIADTVLNVRMVEISESLSLQQSRSRVANPFMAPFDLLGD